MVRRYAQAWGYDLLTHDNGDLVMYELSRIKQGVAEGSENVRQQLNTWMNQDQQFKDQTQRAGFQSKVWPYIQKNINAILSDKGADGKGSYPAAPYAAWLLVQHMDAYPKNQLTFLSWLEKSGLDPTDGKDGAGKLQFLKDRTAVNQWIAANANNSKYFVKGKALPNPTVNVRNPAIFRDAGQVAASRDEALKNAIAAGNKLLVAAVQATDAQTQPSYKSGVAENFADSQENPIKFDIHTPDNFKTTFQITLTVHGKHVGQFNFVRHADTDDVNNEVEVDGRFLGQGYGKLLLLKAIDVANNHGLDFQQDIRGVTPAQQHVYDSLENAGLIVSPGDGFWFLTPAGEQELT
jgi:GNAT superfamily N-acetyltransferase